MSIVRSMRLRRMSGLGVLLMVAVLAAVMMAGPAGATHKNGAEHGGGAPGTTRGKDTLTFKIMVSGDLAGTAFVTGTFPGGGTTIHTERDMVLDMTVFFLGKNADRPGWKQCFDADSFTGLLHISPNKNGPGDSQVNFSFTARDKLGVADVDYWFKAVGRITDTDDWPYWLPGPGLSNTVTGGSWEVHSGGADKKVACKGEGLEGEGPGTLSFEILVTRTA